MELWALDEDGLLLHFVENHDTIAVVQLAGRIRGQPKLSLSMQKYKAKLHDQ